MSLLVQGTVVQEVIYTSEQDQSAAPQQHQHEVVVVYR